ncbi:LolA family protein [Natrarchaeobius oligotrophus]|uniref:Outer membrane lipoprotein carrier protein LolA n=1 Tax=Natrarchaeobius chitinivorans TaxID=1679083 RepID=A0A3N6MIN3_NATCH|nr:outer membrane lipoprotein carrier protein LolA [Natrarchaeobius chitinivorans]RQH03098.1 outer membrane lipoprotein carrier protein LolA [Natrarchaeobius chitinivorans]
MPPRAARRFTLPLLVVAIALLVAGCVALPGDDVSSDDLEDRFETDAPPSEIAATLEVREEINGESIQREEAVWLRDDGASRIETSDGAVVVTDGETRWQYDPETDAVRTIELASDRPSFLEGLYAQQRQYLADDRYAVTELEETALDGRDVYRLAFDPPANETVDRSLDVLVGDTEYVVPLETTDREVDDRGVDRVEVWLDRETLFPIRHAVVGDDLELETTYRNLSVEPDLDDELFEIDSAVDEHAGNESSGGDAGDGGVGEDAQQEGEGDETGTDDESGGEDDHETEAIVLPTIERHETVDSAAELVPFAVAEPDPDSLPDGVEPDGISSYEFPDENRSQVSLFYRSDEGTVSVTTSDGSREFATDGEPVDVGDATGTIAETDEGTELEWSCDGLYYSIFVGDSFADETAIEIAEGLVDGCP